MQKKEKMAIFERNNGDFEKFRDDILAMVTVSTLIFHIRLQVTKKKSAIKNKMRERDKLKKESVINIQDLKRVKVTLFPVISNW